MNKHLMCRRYEKCQERLIENDEEEEEEWESEKKERDPTSNHIVLTTPKS